MDSIIWQLLFQLLLIGLNAVFACAEIAVLSINDNKLAAFAAKGNKRAVRLARLKNQPARFLATIQVAITLSGFLGSAFAADNFSQHIVAWLLSLGVGISASTLDTIAVVLITLILSYFTLVFGELVPKRIAMKNAEKLALSLSALIAVISKIFSPLVTLLTASTNGILRLLRIDPNADDEEISEEEILLMVEAGRKTGVFDTEEQDFIENIFGFDDVTVGEFATHRTEVAILWTDENPEDWEKTIRDSRHTLYPVCDETVDNVVGILNVRDYYLMEDKSTESVLMNAIRPAFFVPESTYADVLFRKMKGRHEHFAIVLDEYGGVFGIVTMNDLLELLVGDLDDCYFCGGETPDIVQLDSGTWKIKGSASLDSVEKALEVELPTDENDTFGGLVFGTYGSVPDDGQEFEVDIPPLHIKVTGIKAHRIETAIVCIDRQTGEPDREE